MQSVQYLNIAEVLFLGTGNDQDIIQVRKYSPAWVTLTEAVYFYGCWVQSPASTQRLGLRFRNIVLLQELQGPRQHGVGDKYHVWLWNSIICSQNIDDPSFFFTTTTGLLQGLDVGWITSCGIISSTISSILSHPLVANVQLFRLF